MKITFSLELTRDKPEPEPYREVDMNSQVELGPPTVGFAVPMHDQGYEDRRR